MTYQYGSNLDIVWDEDPKMLGVRLARYKFVSKMLRGRVLEVGCGDGRLSRVVSKAVQELILTDANPPPEIMKWNPAFEPLVDSFDGVYALDVLEHIPESEEHQFMRRVSGILRPYGTCIIGTPSLESAEYGSRKSKESHINLKTEADLRLLMSHYFKTVFMFGMNDEVVHTGFGPMCHYRLAIGVK